MKKFSYKPPWKMLIDKDLNFKNFMEKTEISKSTFYKLKHNKNVTTDILLKICNEFDCELSDIVECIEEKE